MEQQRHGRVADAFVLVVGDHQRDVGPLAADPGDDGGEHVGQFGADDQQPFGVGLGRGDLQQRDQLAGGGQPVLDQAVVGEFGQFLDADAGVAQHFHHGPGPERAVLFEGQVAALPGVGVLGPDPAGGLGLITGRRRVCPAAVNSSPGRWRSAAAAARRCGPVRPSTQATRAGRTGSRSRVRWSIRDLRRERSFLWATSLALTGQGTAHGPHRAGSSAAHWAMSR